MTKPYTKPYKPTTNPPFSARDPYREPLSPQQERAVGTIVGYFRGGPLPGDNVLRSLMAHPAMVGRALLHPDLAIGDPEASERFNRLKTELNKRRQGAGEPPSQELVGSKQALIRQLAGHVALGEPPLDAAMAKAVLTPGTPLLEEVRAMALLINPDASAVDERVGLLPQRAIEAVQDTPLG